jgi:hypothetical protein
MYAYNIGLPIRLQATKEAAECEVLNRSFQRKKDLLDPGSEIRDPGWIKIRVRNIAKKDEKASETPYYFSHFII